ncbi:hypothetical protein ACSQ67_008323 [Phaseolus vulgaris]
MGGQRSGYGKRPNSQSDYDNGPNKRRNHGEDREQFVIDTEDTVFRYVCPGRKIGSVIGRGGEIVKQLRVETKAKIRIGETVPGCDERVVTIYSPSDETNSVEGGGNYVSPAQDALFKVHDRVVAEDFHGDQDDDGDRLCYWERGQIVQNIRSETGAQIRILKDDHLPLCALSSDELVQITGDAAVVRKALHQVASRLHDNPSRSQHLLTSAVPGVYPGGSSLIGPTPGAPIVGIAPLVGAYGGYKGAAGDWPPRSMYSAPRDEASSKEFSVRLVCPTGNIGGVIGKGGMIINQIRQDSGATIKVDSSSTEGEECLITILTKEFFEETFSPTIEAAVRLQPRCSEKVERDSGIISFTTRLLVSTSRIGCLIGKGGSIITEMRRLTKANIRVISKENLPKIASEDDEMVQISGDLDVAKEALVHVLTRLRANIFDREGALSAFLPVMPYLPVSADGSDGLNFDGRDGKRHGRGHSYSSGYGGSSDLTGGDFYGSYGGSQLGSSGAYGAYGSYSFGRSSSAG